MIDPAKKTAAYHKMAVRTPINPRKYYAFAAQKAITPGDEPWG
jgi:hypothetical protein